MERSEIARLYHFMMDCQGEIVSQKQEENGITLQVTARIMGNETTTLTHSVRMFFNDVEYEMDPWSVHNGYSSYRQGKFTGTKKYLWYFDPWYYDDDYYDDWDFDDYYHPESLSADAKSTRREDVHAKVRDRKMYVNHGDLRYMGRWGTTRNRPLTRRAA